MMDLNAASAQTQPTTTGPTPFIHQTSAVKELASLAAIEQLPSDYPLDLTVALVSQLLRCEVKLAKEMSRFTVNDLSVDLDTWKNALCAALQHGGDTETCWKLVNGCTWLAGLFGDQQLDWQCFVARIILSRRTRLNIEALVAPTPVPAPTRRLLDRCITEQVAVIDRDTKRVVVVPVTRLLTPREENARAYLLKVFARTVDWYAEFYYIQVDPLVPPLAVPKGATKPAPPTPVQRKEPIKEPVPKHRNRDRQPRQEAKPKAQPEQRQQHQQQRKRDGKPHAPQPQAQQPKVEPTPKAEPPKPVKLTIPFSIR